MNRIIIIYKSTVTQVIAVDNESLATDTYIDFIAGYKNKASFTEYNSKIILLAKAPYVINGY